MIYISVRRAAEAADFKHQRRVRTDVDGHNRKIVPVVLCPWYAIDHVCLPSPGSLRVRVLACNPCLVQYPVQGDLKGRSYPLECRVDDRYIHRKR